MRILRIFFPWTKLSPSACASRGSHRGAGANSRWRHLWAREWLRGWNGGSRRLGLLHPGAKKQQRRGNSRLDGCVRLQKQCNPRLCVKIGLLWLQVSISHLSFSPLLSKIHLFDCPWQFGMSYLNLTSLSARFHYTYGLGALDASIELAIYCKFGVCCTDQWFLLEWKPSGELPEFHSHVTLSMPLFRSKIMSIARVETPLENNRLYITSHACKEYSAIFQLIFPMN